MRKLFILATTWFWFALLAFWLGSRIAPDPAPQPVANVTAPERLAQRSLQRIALADIARHATPTDCWMAINGAVYDLTRYLPEHPSRPEIIQPWCGKEASEAYRTKMRGRPHSAAAERLLADYRIGLLTDPPL